MSILVVGTVAIDSIETPFGKRDNVLGGSATYFSLAASLFNKVHVVATVGEDFPKRYIRLLEDKGIGLEGFHVIKGKTFRWEGKYEYDLNVAHTLKTHLNVLKIFDPVIPPDLRKTDFIFLANTDPELQLKVLEQMRGPSFVACDSMNYWITHKKKPLERLLGKVNLFLLNDSEARQLSGEANLMKAARLIVSKGPKAVIIKKGEHGALYLSKRSCFLTPAYLLETIYDPTGAGDTFAGGMMGFLSRAKRTDEATIKKSIIYGSILASFAVEDFSIKRLARLTMPEVRSRYDIFRRITKY
ncbi:MAG: PfkB family carbohydrate kinase [Candidatus Omnitrophica bacterium]|nr:PfkB family carbohydrate kinase [Candidatus Omnitrophota bacterium]